MYQATKLFGSNLRVKLLSLLLFSSKSSFHLRELSRELGASVSHLSKEIDNLYEIGIISISKEKHLKTISLNDNDITQSVKQLLLTLKIDIDELKDITDTIDCRFAIVFGSVAMEKAKLESDIDLMIIGNTIDMKLLYKQIREKEATLKKEIQLVSMTEQEFLDRLEKKDYFIMNVINNECKFLKGNLNEFKDFIKG